MTTDEPLRTEHRRLRAPVAKDADTLGELHDPEFLLVHPGGGEWTKDDTSAASWPGGRWWVLWSQATAIRA